MRVVGLVPSKLNSVRLPRKNVRPLGGRPLINFAIDTLKAAGVPETIIFASNEEVMVFVEDRAACRYESRPPELDDDTATVQDFTGAFLERVSCDVVVLLHATSPFIKPSTVGACISAVVGGHHESAFAALEIKRFAWFQGAPLNYRLDKPTPRTQDLEAVIIEQSGLYVFTRELFERTGRRISDDPFIHIVDPVEGHDIDTAEEFDLAESILQATGHSN